MKPWKKVFSPYNPFRSIQWGMSASFSVVILVAIALISFTSYRISVRSVEANSESYLTEVIKQVNANIQSYIDNMENISMLIFTNKDVKYYISRNVFLGNEELRSYEKRISDLFQSLLYTRKDIASIMVFGYNGKVVSDHRITNLNPNTILTEQEWYRSAVNEGGKSVVSAPHVQNIIRNDYRWVVSLSRELKSSDGITGEGVSLVDLNLSVINQICSNIKLGNRGYVFIVDQQGNIVYHPQQTLIYSNLRSELIDRVMSSKEKSFIADDQEGRRIYSIQDTSFGWKIIGVAYTNELIAHPSAMRSSFIAWELVGLAVTLVISFLLSHRLSRPIRSLQEVMKQVERGNFEVRAEIKQMNEIGQLSRTFNMMVRQIKELMEHVIHNEKTKRRTELALLQAQINPHFLYNTLDSIIWMAEQQKNEEVVEMTAALAKLFRASIAKDDEMITIRVEIEHISSYLMIQKMRYKDMLDYRIDVPNEVLKYKTQRILLQPFVENAIYHSIRNMSEGGLIVITARALESSIIFEIIDNGSGMDADTIIRVLSPQQLETDRKHVGIHNVNERIKLFFGAEYGVSITSKLDEGTCIRIEIPKLR